MNLASLPARLLAAFAALFLLITTASAQNPNFSGQPPFTAPAGSARIIALADFNADNKYDLATLGYVANNSGGATVLSIYLGDGVGGFASTPVATATVIPCGGAIGLKAFGLDATGSYNLAVLCNSGLQIWHATRTGASVALATTNDMRQTINMGDQPTAMAIGDFTGAGAPGVAVLIAGTGARAILYFPPTVCAVNGTCFGQPTFLPLQTSSAGVLYDYTPVVASTREIAYAITAVPVVGKSYPALVAATRDLVAGGGHIIPILYNPATSLFVASTQTAIPAPNVPEAIASADFNGDGKADIVVAGPLFTNTDTSTPGFIARLSGNGDGTFGAPTVFESAGPQVLDNNGLITIDLNSDGKADVIAAGPYAQGANSPYDFSFYYLGKGDGTFQSPQTLANSVSSTNASTGGGVTQVAISTVGLIGSADAVSVDLIGTIVNGTLNFINPTPALSLQTFSTGGSTRSTTTLTGATTSSGGTLTATVAPATATGYVQFFDATTQVWVGSALLSSGVATLSVSGAGSHLFYASYQTANIIGSVSTPIAVGLIVPLAALTNTSTTLSVSNSNPYQGTAIIFTSTVAAASGNITPGGTVTFLDGTTAFGTGALDSTGKATYSTSALSVATHAITASYGGSTTFATSISPAVTVTVKPPVPTTSTLTATPAATTPGGNILFNLTVAGSGGTPSGNFTILEGNTFLYTGVLDSNGKASFSISSLPLGNHSITSAYAGDATFATSTSAAVSILIKNLTTTTTVLNPSSFSPTAGTPVIITANVSGTGGLPTGTVTFKEGSTVLGTGTLDGSGNATFTISTLTVGTHAILATYAGDPTFSTSTSATISITVKAAIAASSAALTASATTVTTGQAITFTLKVTSTATGIPSGTVSFKDGATILSSATLDATGTTTYLINTLSVGAHSISAVYSGDTNFATSTSNALAITINAVTADFTLSGSNLNLTLRQGQTGLETITLTPAGGFTGTIVLGCGTLPTGTTCTFAPASLVADGTNKVLTSQLSLVTTGLGTGTVSQLHHPGQSSSTFLAALNALPALAFGLLITWQRRRFKLLPRLLALCAVAGFFAISGCAGGSPANPPNTTPAGTYPITITAGVTGGTAHTLALNIIVTQ